VSTEGSVVEMPSCGSSEATVDMCFSSVILLWKRDELFGVLQVCLQISGSL